MKKAIGVILVVIFAYMLYKQVEVECYISKQKGKYGILKNKERINHIPYLIHFFRVNYFCSDCKELEIPFLPYQTENIDSFISDKDFDRYMVYSYYSKKDIESACLKIRPNGSDMR